MQEREPQGEAIASWKTPRKGYPTAGRAVQFGPVTLPKQGRTTLRLCPPDSSEPAEPKGPVSKRMPSLPFKFDAQGLVPAIVQDEVTGEIRMFAFATEAAVRTTIETGRATFWSRSRGELWQRARVGGLETPVVRVLADCDADCLIYACDPQGPSCHSGAPSCFFQTLEGGRLVQTSEPAQSVLAWMEATVRASRVSSHDPADVGGGRAAAEKVREEAGGLAQAIEGESDDRVIAEAANTLFALLGGLGARSIPLRRVLAELDQRRRDPSADPGVGASE